MVALLIQLTIFLSVIGLIWWLTTNVLPTPPMIKQIITVVLSVLCVAVTAATLLGAFGLIELGSIGWRQL